MFPYSENLEFEKGVCFNYQTIIDKIGPLLTPERRQRIDQTIQGRNFETAIVLENIYDRGNASAVMRTGEAFGFQLFEVIELSEKFKEANRVTAGAEKWIHQRKWKSTEACVQKLKSEGFQICVTALSEKSVPIAQIDFSKKTALVLGNEKAGVSKEMLSLCDQQMIIPMDGFVQSFNISVAGALCMYHARSERQRLLGKSASVDEKQKEILRALYYYKTLDSAQQILTKAAGIFG